MAVEASEPSTTYAAEPKGINPMRNLIEGLLPSNLGDANADQIAQQNLQRAQDKKNPQPKLPQELPKTPQVTPKPTDTKIPAPDAPIVAEPEPTPEPKQPRLSDDLPDIGFDDKLLEALEPKVPEKKIEPKTDAKSVPTEKLLTGEVDPSLAIPEPEVDVDAPVEVPKTADAIKKALIDTSKLLRQKNKLIKELESRGKIDTAAIAIEPLQQRIQALEAEKAQFLNQVASVRLEADPEIQRMYLKPLQMAETFINDVAKGNEGVSARELFQAANEGDRAKRKAAVRTACSELHPSDAFQVEQAVDAIHDLNIGLNAKRGNASQIMAQKEQQQQQAIITQQAQFRANSVKAHDETFNDFIADPVLNHFIEKDPEVKKKLGGVLKAAKAAEVDTSWVANDKLRARMMQQGLAFPVVVKLYQNELKSVLGMVKKLQAENLSLKKPGLSTQPRSHYTPPAEPAKPMSTAELVRSTIGDAFKGR